MTLFLVAVITSILRNRWRGSSLGDGTATKEAPGSRVS